MELVTKAFERIDRQVKYSLHKKDKPVIVAGLGRCGTTLLKESIIQTRGYDSVFMGDLQNAVFNNGTLYKTHDYPDFISLKNDPKIIFMFGSPMNTAISASKRINAWGKEHFIHLRSDKFVPNEQLFYEDGLLLETLFDSWYKPQQFRFLSLRYESLYNERTIDTINEFLGFNVKLIPFQKRKSNWKDHPKKDDLLRTYKGLMQKIEKADDVKIWEPKS